MKSVVSIIILLLFSLKTYCWGFYAHRQINYYAVFLLPPDMLVLYKKNISYLSEHATDPDKRRYAVAEEGPRHYIDIDHYGKYPFDSLPRKWNDALAKFSADTLNTYGIVPWWIQTMLYRLTEAFKEKNASKILKFSAEIGHYISDAHVPLHAHSNHNGQHTGQQGIHGFWESRLPELLAASEWDFFIGKAIYIEDPLSFTWKRILESAAAADSVLTLERKLSSQFAADQKFAFEERNGAILRQYSTSYAVAFNKMLNNMVERRMRQSIFAVASFWYTAWVNAGQPNLQALASHQFSDEEKRELDSLNTSWRNGQLRGRPCD